MDRRAIWGHSLVLLTTLCGIAGMGIIFNGITDGSLREVSQGIPLLLIGLWWSGRQLGRSLALSRARRTAPGQSRGDSR